MEEALARFGQAATVESPAGAADTRAFIQPLRERRETAVGAVSGIGWSDERLWLYLGTAAAKEGDTVLWQGQRFYVRSGRPVYLGEQVSHWRALLERAKEAAD